MNSSPTCIKSVPASELEVTAMVYTFVNVDATGQDNDGRDYTDTETELLNPELDASATFDPATAGKCACCGSTRLVYACRVVHKPTLTGHYIGRDCASKLMNMAAGKLSQLSVALAEQAAGRRRRNWWLTQNPQHREIVAWAETANHHIAADIVRKLKGYGSISEAQVGLLHKIKAQMSAREEAEANEPVPTGPAPEGRLEVEVECIGTKDVENTFSRYSWDRWTTKALVRLAGYNTKAWLTAAGLNKGDRAIIRATFTRSNNDPHFAFGSRPKVMKRL